MTGTKRKAGAADASAPAPKKAKPASASAPKKAKPAPPKDRRRTLYLDLQDDAAGFEAWRNQPLAQQKKWTSFGRVQVVKSKLSPAELTEFNTYKKAAKKVENWYNELVNDEVSPAALDNVCRAISSQNPTDEKARIYMSGKGTEYTTRESKTKKEGGVSAICNARKQTFDRLRRAALNAYLDAPYAKDNAAPKKRHVLKPVVLHIQTSFNEMLRKDLFHHGLDTTYFHGHLDQISFVKATTHKAFMGLNINDSDLEQGNYWYGTKANPTISPTIILNFVMPLAPTQGAATNNGGNIAPLAAPPQQPSGVSGVTGAIAAPPTSSSDGTTGAAGADVPDEEDDFGVKIKEEPLKDDSTDSWTEDAFASAGAAFGGSSAMESAPSGQTTNVTRWANAPKADATTSRISTASGGNATLEVPGSRCVGGDKMEYAAPIAESSNASAMPTISSAAPLAKSSEVRDAPNTNLDRTQSAPKGLGRSILGRPKQRPIEEYKTQSSPSQVGKQLMRQSKTSPETPSPFHPRDGGGSGTVGMSNLSETTNAPAKDPTNEVPAPGRGNEYAQAAPAGDTNTGVLPPAADNENGQAAPARDSAPPKGGNGGAQLPSSGDSTPPRRGLAPPNPNHTDDSKAPSKITATPLEGTSAGSIPPNMVSEVEQHPPTISSPNTPFAPKKDEIDGNKDEAPPSKDSSDVQAPPNDEREEVAPAIPSITTTPTSQSDMFSDEGIDGC